MKILPDQSPAVYQYLSSRHQINRHFSHCFVDFITNEGKIADINLLLQMAIIRKINRNVAAHSGSSGTFTGK